MTDDSGAPDVRVLRPVSVLTDPRVADEPPTITDGLRCLRDVRVLGPTPTVGDVSFAGRLGRRVAARRDRVAPTLVGDPSGPVGPPGGPTDRPRDATE